MTYTIVGVYTCRRCGYNTGCQSCWNTHRELCTSGPRSVPSRRWHRTVVGDDVWCDLTDTIDMGDQ